MTYRRIFHIQFDFNEGLEFDFYLEYFQSERWLGFFQGCLFRSKIVTMQIIDVHSFVFFIQTVNSLIFDKLKKNVLAYLLTGRL